ncbi:hypothetical protein [Agrobacterium vitis]|uniref:hypothetical protein n=1 Tax=Agrobacterium vitis TaxID=373 RepID=UPI0012E979EB|nr:hypothetical protein [Agrobacterium vitis]MVA33647.1 hypothetical protein [Agrobacterium vitis]
MTEHPLKTASLADKIAYVQLICDLHNPGVAKQTMQLLGIGFEPLLEEIKEINRNENIQVRIDRK